MKPLDSSISANPSFLIMGVVNITPDSFSDGGRFFDPKAAVDQARTLIAEGADLVDLGAESSRPGSRPIDIAQERERLFPVLAELLRHVDGYRISIDTRRAEVMLEAASMGARTLNDVEGLVDRQSLSQLARYQGMRYLAMHMNGTPATMQTAPLARAVAVETVSEFFRRTHEELLAAGFPEASIWLDPGIGFGKTDGANLALLAHTNEFAKSYNIAVGVSRKSLIGRALKIQNPVDRDIPGKMLELGLTFAGARMIRTHDVKRLAELRDHLDQGP